MPKNKRPVTRKPAQKTEQDDDVMAQAMADLALDVAVPEDPDPEALRQKDDELERMVRDALRRKNDQVLYDAVERARYSDIPAYQLLRERIEDASGTVVVRREGMPAVEINAFAIPLFAHSTGGLSEAEGFNDPDAFAALVDSLREARLESAEAKVVLVAHAYDPEEAARISYCQLNEIVRDVHASMTARKLQPTPALDRSITGWVPRALGAEDATVELRFLLGFALKRVDDPFYSVPGEEAAADAWFNARMARYRAWTEQAAPLVRRCLAAKPDTIEVNFLYQDLFFGALEQGFGELATLQMMTRLNQALEQRGLAPYSTSARVAPEADGDDLVLRVTLVGHDGSVLATVDKPLDVDADLEGEISDVRDALGAIGIGLLDDAGNQP